MFWRDRRWLEAHPVGAVLERDYVPGEVWSEHHFREPTDLTRVRVWWIDLFQETTAARGYIRARELLGGTTFVTHDAEDAVNWMFRDDPPDDGELPDVRVPSLPAAAWRPRSGLPLDTWPAVRWIVSADLGCPGPGSRPTSARPDRLPGARP